MDIPLDEYSDSESDFEELAAADPDLNDENVMFNDMSDMGVIEVQTQQSSEMEQNTSDHRTAYDIALPSQHSYLGGELEAVRGRTVLEDGAEVVLDIIRQADITIVPGWTLPLYVLDPATIAMLQACLHNDRTFGVLADWDYREVRRGDLGTTAEIFEYRLDNGFLSGKAKARQRFKVLDCDSQSSRLRARVKILPEANLGDPLASSSLQVLNRLRSSVVHKQRLRRMDAAVTRWPLFVYDQYDGKRLVAEVKQALSVDITKGDGIALPETATELSFWVAQNMPMKPEHRLLLLGLNSPIQRLRWQMHALQQRRQVLVCLLCSATVGFGSDVFAMSAEGAQSTYVNPAGHMHETITLHQVRGISAFGRASAQFSWFPGYAWICSNCDSCGQHMGWKFVATNARLKPKSFWGICRKSINIRMAEQINLTEIKDLDDNRIVF